MAMSQTDSKNPDWVNDKRWADQYMPGIVSILRAYSFALLTIEQSDIQGDAHEGTDLVVRIRGGTVAVRIRRPNCRYRDLTIRSWRMSGQDTELEKIKAGYADWYLYVWTEHDGQISEHIFVDLHRLRASGLLETAKETVNPDGVTAFVSIPIPQLEEYRCLIHSEK